MHQQRNISVASDPCLPDRQILSVSITQQRLKDINSLLGSVTLSILSACGNKNWPLSDRVPKRYTVTSRVDCSQTVNHDVAIITCSNQAIWSSKRNTSHSSLCISSQPIQALPCQKLMNQQRPISSSTPCQRP